MRSENYPSWRHRFQRLLGHPVIYDLRSYWKRVEHIESLEPTLKEVRDDELMTGFAMAAPQAREQDWRGEQTAIAVAIVREAARRTLEKRLYPEQILAGLAMLDGRVAEMQTGEGKTLAGVAPVALHAVTGGSAHVLSCNDYLARRDAEWMGPVYQLLGLSVSYVIEGMESDARSEAYASQICYLTAREAGFDFLRDRLRFDQGDVVQRSFDFVLVDELDSILIDEARIPLVIAGDEAPPAEAADRLARLAREFEPGRDYDTDEYGHNIFVTEEGARRAEVALGCGSLFESEHLIVLAELRNALHAEALLRRDVDYIVRDGRVELVDDFTGRVADLRRWPDGLQAAVEAKERVMVQRDGRVLGTITVRHLIDVYEVVSGMTATAQAAAEEIKEAYGLEVVVIPTHRPCLRIDHRDRIFTHGSAKTAALVAEISEAHDRGQPVLVGTASVAESEALAEALAGAQLEVRVLNAKNDAEEAEIVAGAGAFGAITISTNMAGRGTDIRLGGSEEVDRDAVVALGGLYVIGTNRHESRRVDQQLRGRAGRQGDPGSSRFFISLEDPLMQRYGLIGLIPASRCPVEQINALEDPAVVSAVESAQRIIEGVSFDAQRRLDQYSSLIEGQRQAVHSWRQSLLTPESGSELLQLRCATQYRKFEQVLGFTALNNVERRLSLLAIDRCWADHLSEAQRIKDGIHVVGFVGKDPLTEYTRELGKAFADLQNRIDDEIIESFENLEPSSEREFWDQEALRGPSATWTYMVHDDPFGSNELRKLANHAASAAPAAIFAGPFLFLWSLVLAWRSRRGRRNS